MAIDSALVGWRDPPDGRGTFDIIKTCIFTMFLLCWSSVCPNVPSVSRGRWALNKAKLQLFLVAILSPDFVFATALGQFNLAYRSKKAFAKAGYRDWSLRHYFFVNMGGLHLRFADHELAGKPTFPVNCQQLLYLIQNKHIDLPKIDVEDIEDRNKADILARGVTLVQSTWFTINSIGRLAQGLHLTTLELTTLTFVYVMVACSIFWWRKPMDITRPIVIPVAIELRATLQNANAPLPLTGRTPLSYLDDKLWFMGRLWIYFRQILWNLRCFGRQQDKPAESDHFIAMDFHEIDAAWEVVAAPITFGYAGIFVGAWSFEFPSPLERYMWRASSIFTLCYCVLGPLSLAVEQHFSRDQIASYWRKLILNMSPRTKLQWRQHPWAKSLTSIHYRIDQRLDHLRNISPDKDPNLEVSVLYSLGVLGVSVLYCFTRAFILVEDGIGLRALPESAYKNVDYGPYSPIL